MDLDSQEGFRTAWKIVVSWATGKHSPILIEAKINLVGLFVYYFWHFHYVFLQILDIWREALNSLANVCLCLGCLLIIWSLCFNDVFALAQIPSQDTERKKSEPRRYQFTGPHQLFKWVWDIYLKAVMLSTLNSKERKCCVWRCLCDSFKLWVMLFAPFYQAVEYPVIRARFVSENLQHDRAWYQNAWEDLEAGSGTRMHGRIWRRSRKHLQTNSSWAPSLPSPCWWGV